VKHSDYDQPEKKLNKYEGSMKTPYQNAHWSFEHPKYKR